MPLVCAIMRQQPCAGRPTAEDRCLPFSAFLFAESSAVAGLDLRPVYSVPDRRSEEIRSFPRIPANNRAHLLRARTPPRAEKSTHFAFHASSGTSPRDDSMFLNFQDLMKFKVFLAAKLPASQRPGKSQSIRPLGKIEVPTTIIACRTRRRRNEIRKKPDIRNCGRSRFRVTVVRQRSQQNKRRTGSASEFG